MKKQLFLALLLPLTLYAGNPAIQQATIDLFLSIENGDVELFKDALIRYADVNAVNISTGCTPLMALLA